MEHVTIPHEDALLIIAEINGYNVKRVLIDSCSSTYVLFLEALKKMGRSEKGLEKVKFPLTGFPLNETYPVGAITRPVHIGEGWKTLTINFTFIMVDSPYSYNAIFGCSTLHPHMMVHST